MNQKSNWIENPTKTKLIISLTVYLISLTIMVAIMTDFFQEPLDLKVNVILSILNIIATLTIIKVVRSFYTKH